MLSLHRMYSLLDSPSVLKAQKVQGHVVYSIRPENSRAYHPAWASLSGGHFGSSHNQLMRKQTYEETNNTPSLQHKNPHDQVAISSLALGGRK